MVLIGTNIRRDGSDPLNVIVQSGAQFVRFVPLADTDLTAYLTGLLGQKIMPLAVLAKESFGLGPGPIDWRAVESALATYRARYGTLVTAWQVGNEWDAESPSSWTMGKNDLVALGQRVRSAFGKSAYLIVGGCADGSPSDEPDERLSGMDLGWANAIAIHTYGQGVPGWKRDDGFDVLPFSPYGFTSTVRDLIDGYRAEAPTKDLWITEMGFRWDELGEVRAAQYAEAYLSYLVNRCPEVKGFAQFCLTDLQVNGFGLYSYNYGQHQTAPIFQKYANQARAGQPPAPSPVPTPLPSKPMTAAEAEDAAYRDLFLAATQTAMNVVYAPTLGIVKFWRQNLSDLGSAVGPEHRAETGEVFQGFALGVVKWDPTTGASKVA